MPIVDLSFSVESDTDWAPFGARNKVKYQDHKGSRFLLWLKFRLTPKYLRTGLGWANDWLHISTHGTTHLDAPYHYAPTSEGKPARTIDQIPLEWCYSDGVVLDMRHRKHGEAITVQDVQDALQKIDYTLKPMDIVLIQTGNDRNYGTPEYFTVGAGMSAEATAWLVDQGIKVMGIDSWGWDRPLNVEAEEAKRTGRDDVFWAAHYVGVDKEYCHMERLTNLDALPPHGFKVSCFPLKVKNGSAGPSRVVAFVAD